MNSNTKLALDDREAYFQKIENEAITLFDSTKRKVSNILKVDCYKTLLQLFSRFHRYSYINIILIYLQFPDAVYIAGFDTWKTSCLNIWNDPSRQVIKPEYQKNGIRLLAPYTQVTDKENRRVFNFVVKVYEASQTNDIPPLEEEKEFLTKPTLKNLLSALRFHSPYRITYAGREDQIINNGLKGYCNHSNGLIVLDETLKYDSLLKETFRQIVCAEIELFDLNLSRMDDLIIESVVYVLSLHFGVSLEYTDLLFVSRYRNNSDDELSTALFLIQRISHKLIEQIESFLGDIEVYAADTWANETALLNFDIEEEY